MNFEDYDVALEQEGYNIKFCEDLKEYKERKNVFEQNVLKVSELIFGTMQHNYEKAHLGHS